MRYWYIIKIGDNMKQGFTLVEILAVLAILALVTLVSIPATTRLLERNKLKTYETSDKMKALLEAVVAEGSGNKGQVEGYRIGGKTATSEKLPRGNKKYISSFLGFAPAEHPQIIGLILIDEPVGIYYGGTIAAPVMAELYANILPYLGIEAYYTDEKSQEVSDILYMEDTVE